VFLRIGPWLPRKLGRRGRFASVKELVAAIQAYLDEFNRAPKRFVWSESADELLAKSERCKARQLRHT
jgi:hypothetical protein